MLALAKYDTAAVLVKKKLLMGSVTLALLAALLALMLFILALLLASLFL